MKRISYIASALLILFSASSCYQQEDTPVELAATTPIKGVVLGMVQTESLSGAVTKADGSIFSVNTAADPTSASSTEGSIQARGTNGWLLDFSLYNASVASATVYAEGSFTGGVYDQTKEYWTDNSSMGQRYFPNYKNPKADFILYPDRTDKEISLDQSTAEKLLAQDLLEKIQDSLLIAHQLVYSSSRAPIYLNHKRAMIDFVIQDIDPDDIDAVTVSVGDKIYSPYLVKKTTSSLEYLLILSENTQEDPVVEIVTKETSFSRPKTYKQTIDAPYATLGGNRCYQAILSGNLLELAPITVTDWTTGEPVSGEYVAVTAYPTFKGPANTTYYLYYDNALKDADGNPVLQKITFNEYGECMIKPDGRILTHWGTENDLNELIPLVPPIVLDKMIITLPMTD